MRRREFITLLGGAVTWPLAARAQQPAMPMIGFLNRCVASARSRFSLRRSARAWVKRATSRAVTSLIEYRWAEGLKRSTSLRWLADLVRRQVAVIAATGGNAAALAAKTATTKIPIVFSGGGDPVQVRPRRQP